MPELPEVHALAADLDGRLRGREVARLDLLSFAALKTFDPPVSAVDREIRRRTDSVGIFPNRDAIIRLVEAANGVRTLQGHLMRHAAISA